MAFPFSERMADLHSSILNHTAGPTTTQLKDVASYSAPTGTHMPICTLEQRREYDVQNPQF
ncbi:hypothetical protein DES53_102758 [Roseimicrobium gellanilyticum]|uniref:Uncharacterized protein n=1 Tax=Roseimicrobium gellanilyticum TaxID=748857 RepID=A0A366HUI0_9BACT|nr:hypothetical protein DES53_102758 [Roseimicrobium gellanilyticum]